MCDVINYEPFGQKEMICQHKFVFSVGSLCLFCLLLIFISTSIPEILFYYEWGEMIQYDPTCAVFLCVRKTRCATSTKKHRPAIRE